MDKFKKLKSKVEVWAKEKGILDNATPSTQHLKTIEEVNELGLAIIFQANDMTTFVDEKGVLKITEIELKDAIGDVLVTLIIQAKLNNLDITGCLEMAYNTISKRTGKMVDGLFVKDDPIVKCIECGYESSPKELKKYGGVCDACSEKTENFNNTKKKKGKCIGTIVGGKLGGLKLKK